MLAALLACAPPPPAPDPTPAPPPEPEFLPGRTYAVIDVDDPRAADGIRTFCDVTVLRRYRLRNNRQNWPTCSSRELLIGVTRPGDSRDGVGAELGDGRRIRVWEIFDLAAGLDAAPLAGQYVLAARSQRQDTIEIFTGRVPVYRIEPGRIHYLGRMDGTGPVAARDTQGFSEAFLAHFPQIPPDRLELSGLGGLDVICEPALGSTADSPTGFDCTGKRVRGGFF